MKVAVFGAGESGVGAALLAQKLRYNVVLWDDFKIKPEVKESLDSAGISYREGLGETIFEEHVDLVIKSPGVPNGSWSVLFARANGVRLISEIEFGFLHFNGKVIAITGSNGKTTTSGLFFHLLKTNGFDVMIGGNYGTSFCRIITEHSPEYMVLEVSSFQLDDVETFSPDIAILLNITPDHLDRYDYEIENYANAKLNIAKHLGAHDLFIYNGDDEIIAKQLDQKQINSRTQAISALDYLDGVLKQDQSTFKLSLEGRHNRFNAAAVVAGARDLGLTDDQIEKGLSTFSNLPHRLEFCGEIGGVKFVNDSKATNVDATWFALDAMKESVIWIAGGTDKGNDYSAVDELADEKVKGLVCLGVDNEKLINHFAKRIKTVNTDNIKDAVQKAFELAEKGDTILLSPACASFDLFKNYIDRGNKFKEEVEILRTIDQTS